MMSCADTNTSCLTAAALPNINVQDDKPLLTNGCGFTWNLRCCAGNAGAMQLPAAGGIVQYHLS